MTNSKTSWIREAPNVFRGLLMGGADIIPGVSGGTVALILGIYERLVTALSHFDLTLLDHLRHRRFGDAMAHLDLRFLVLLGSGILLGVGGLAKLMNYLLLEHPVPTWSLFFGLIFASAILVARMIGRFDVLNLVLGIAGTIFAFWLVGLVPREGPPGFGYLFLCGMVAICAMILPGISGAYILLIMGKYEYVTHSIGDFVHGVVLLPRGKFAEAGELITPTVFFTLVVFGIGCVVGLLSFSKLLRWLLARHEPQTMAVLCGFMFGSLRKIWPFKKDLTPSVEDLKEKIYVNTMPDSFNSEVMLSIALALLAVAFVLGLDWIVRGHERISPLEAEDHEPTTTG